MKIHLDLKGSEDKSYDILIGCTFPEIADSIKRLEKRSSFFIITDTTVVQHYGDKLVSLLKERGVKAEMIAIPAGEENKNRKTKEVVEDRLLELQADRDSLIIALGGGVVGDLAGFVAATLQRGVPFVQIPTTLIAQVDASIGGKVAVDHPLGKNLIGAFYQPKRVYIDPSTLSSLPSSEFRNGMAEVIKYAVTMDQTFFNYLERNVAKIEGQDRKILQSVISRCCMFKKNIVEQDEKEAGLRRILNYGHTIGHAIERLSNYRMPHGEAVAIGMMMEAQISQSLGFTTVKEVLRLRSLLKLYGLPVHLPQTMNMDDLLNATLSDKKTRKGIVNYTLLEGIGQAKVGVGLTIDKAKRALMQ